MKIFISAFLCLFQINAFANQAQTDALIEELHKTIERKKNGPDINEILRETQQRHELYQFESNIRKKQLEKAYPERMDATNFRDAFDKGKDVPARFLNISSESIQNSWNIPESTDQVPYEIEIIRDLNIRSAEVWEKMLRCHKNSSDPAEEARRNYFEGKFCDRTIKSDLDQLHGDLYNHLTTTRISNVVYQKHTAVKSYVFDQDTRKTLSSWHVFPAVHPLFTQMLFEINIINNLFPKIDGQPSKNLMSFAERMQYDFSTDPNEFNLTEDERQQYIALYNSSMLLMMIEPHRCDLLSFWPGALRPIIRSVGPLTRFLPFMGISTNLLNSCGTPDISSVYGPFNDGLNHATNSRHRGSLKGFISTIRNIGKQYL